MQHQKTSTSLALVRHCGVQHSQQYAAFALPQPLLPPSLFDSYRTTRYGRWFAWRYRRHKLQLAVRTRCAATCYANATLSSLHRCPGAARRGILRGADAAPTWCSLAWRCAARHRRLYALNCLAGTTRRERSASLSRPPSRFTFRDCQAAHARTRRHKLRVAAATRRTTCPTVCAVASSTTVADARCTSFGERRIFIAVWLPFDIV